MVDLGAVLLAGFSQVPLSVVVISSLVGLLVCALQERQKIAAKSQVHRCFMFKGFGGSLSTFVKQAGKSG